MLMSVHLKSGCFDNSSTSSACSTLMSKIPVLESWIDDAAEGALPFIILGDFNRRFNQPGKEFWNKISDHCPVVVELWIP